jgi:hypothetical protein
MSNKGTSLDLKDLAHLVPFVLRAWWLKDNKEYAELNFGEEDGLKGDLWSRHSDPICDLSDIEEFNEI